MRPPILPHLDGLLKAVKIHTGLQLDSIPGTVRYSEVFTARCSFAYLAHYCMAARCCDIADALVLSRMSVTKMLDRAEAVLQTGIDIGLCDHGLLRNNVRAVWSIYITQIDTSGRMGYQFID